MIEHLYIVPILLLSIIVHEIAHGWMALRLGDPTAKLAGRLTLNPVPHIDPVGSILVPLFSLVVAGNIFIAWAKPVPVDPRNFLRPRRDDLLVSMVGPLSNVIMAILCTLAAVGVLLLLDPVRTLHASLADKAITFLLQMFYGGVYLNIILAIFNLIPVPPLDGSHMLASVLPRAAAAAYTRIGFLGIFVLLVLMRLPAFNAVFGAVTEGLFSPLRALIRLFLP